MEAPGITDMGTQGGTLVPTTYLLEMRDVPGLAPETHGHTESYHGTRMDQKALTFHTKLYEWNEAQNVASVAHRHALTMTSSKEGDVYLPTKKLAQIEYWTKDVNKYYLPKHTCRPKTGSFMTIDVSKYNIKKDEVKDARRVKSAIYPANSINGGLFTTPNSVAPKRFFGNDIHTVRNNLVQSQLHYSAQRKDIYIPSRSRVTSGKSGEQVFPEDLLEIQSVSSIACSEGSTSSSTSTLTEPQNLEHIDREIMQPKIVARSYSNRMLNVISIDDCKLTCRYRPQTIKETPSSQIKGRKIKQEQKKVYVNSNKDCIRVVVKGDSDTSLNETMNGHDESGEEPNAENGHEADDEGGSSDDNIKRRCNSEVMPNREGITINGETNHAGDKPDPNTVNVQNGSIYVGHSGSKTKVKKKPLAGKENSTVEYPITNGVHNFSSRGTSRTSFCRITDLDVLSESSNSHTEDKLKKKPSRASQINQAINNLVTERTVLKPMDRDFDTKTAVFGRTKVDRSEGSETFKRIHSKLRKQIDTYVNTHSALKTMEFYEKRRKNSAISSTK